MEFVLLTECHCCWISLACYTSRSIRLIGRPWQLAPNGNMIAGGLSDLRVVLTSYNSLLARPSVQVSDLAELRSKVAEVHRTYQAARYDDVVTALPGVLAAVEGFPGRRNGERREALLAYVSAYVVAAKLVTKLGAGDLALLAADRAATAAVDSESRTARGMAGYQVACALLQADQVEDGERLAVSLAEDLSPHIRSDHPSLVSVAGALWLISAIAGARRTDRTEAWARIDRAGALAGLLGEDGNHAWTAFGPTNVAIHRVSTAAELGDPGEALRASDVVDTDRLRAGLKSRRAQVHLDLAWAQAQRKRDADAVLHLMEAERVAPEMVRY